MVNFTDFFLCVNFVVAASLELLSFNERTKHEIKANGLEIGLFGHVWFRYFNNECKI